MCLAVPARVVELADDENCKVDLGGIQKIISLALVDDVEVGDYVVVHVGYALGKVDAAEAEATIEALRALGDEALLEAAG